MSIDDKLRQISINSQSWTRYSNKDELIQTLEDIHKLVQEVMDERND
jgi:hypothetical protein